MTFLTGVITGVILAVFGYFGLIHSSIETSILPAGTPAYQPTISVNVIPQTVDFEEEDLSTLAQLPVTDLWDRLGLTEQSPLENAELHRILDDWPCSHFAWCDKRIAIPIRGSENYLVVGILYDHCHVVSAFLPRWIDSEP